MQRAAEASVCRLSAAALFFRPCMHAWDCSPYAWMSVHFACMHVLHVCMYTCMRTCMCVYVHMPPLHLLQRLLLVCACVHSM